MKKKSDIEYTIDADESIIQDAASNGNEYICDAISETADNSVDVYNSDLFDWAARNYEYCDDAARSGLVDLKSDNILIKMMQAGQYEYYSQMLYDNIKAIVLLYAFDYMDTDEIPDDLAELLSDQAGDFDRFADIAAAIDEYKAHRIRIDSRLERR